MVDTKTLRTLIKESDSIAFGCSHTWGMGVEAHESWPHLLGAINYGINGCSADYIVRMAPYILDQHMVDTVYILWPDWTRFDVQTDDGWKTILPTDPNRILFMDTHDENWLKNNFYNQINIMREICDTKKIQLVDMTLYDLIIYIDHADKWPLSKLGHHYSPRWHGWVADIFNWTKKNNIQHPLNET